FAGFAFTGVCSLSRCGSRLESDALPERRRVVDAAVADRPAHAADVPDRVERVGVEHDEVGTLAALDGPELAIELHGARGNDGRRLQRLDRRQPCLDVELDFAVEAVPGNTFVGAGDDRHAGIVERLHDPQAALEPRAGGLRVDARGAGVR